MRAKAITLLKEDVLTLGQMVERSLAEMERLVRKEPYASLSLVETQEEMINASCQEIEEKCLELLMEKDSLDARQIRTLVGSTIIAAKFERIADHANRVARVASWANEERIDIPPEMAQMAQAVQRMLKDVLLCFLTEDSQKAIAVVKKDCEVDFLHDYLYKNLLFDLGGEDRAAAHMKAQFLFCARFIERMGDACSSIAKRVFFIVTGERLRAALSRAKSELAENNQEPSA